MTSLDAGSVQSTAALPTAGRRSIALTTFAACIAAAVIGVAFATPPAAGPGYTEGQIRSFVIAGMRLGMTDDAATAILRSVPPKDPRGPQTDGRSALASAIQAPQVTLSKVQARDGVVRVSGVSSDVALRPTAIDPVPAKHDRRGIRQPY